MKVFFIDDSSSTMAKMFKDEQKIGYKALFMELLDNKITPVTIFFGNYENESNSLLSIGDPELQMFLDEYATYLDYNDFIYNEETAIYYKGKFSVDIETSAFLLYENNEDPEAKNILQEWDNVIKTKLNYKAGENGYGSDKIEKCLKRILERIKEYFDSKDDIFLVDMMLVLDDNNRFGESNNINDIPDKPILSMIIYHYLKTNNVKCAVYSSFSTIKFYQDKWVKIYEKFFNDDNIEKEKDDEGNFIIDRQMLDYKTIIGIKER